ncbi:cilia- and flagella-associated protein 44 [Trichosurus vulpecula]|uniref:cilia- and flagella-associated protein 44 n=1 Tax=Trichosurus vulpecula TaxID=9337 RepID=UPI00186AF3CE|nr:cilia- and flagella-associated protein 44 [Trichosurus vulpecula]
MDQEEEPAKPDDAEDDDYQDEYEFQTEGEESEEISTETAAEQSEYSYAEDPFLEEMEESGSEQMKKISENFFYNYNEVVSVPFVTEDSGIPSNLLTLIHSFGYDSTKRSNLQLLDSQTIIFIAGNQIVFVDLRTHEQRYLRSSSGRGIGALAVHPDKTYFVLAEKGFYPNVVIYDYPALRPYRILRGGTDEAYAYASFNFTGSLLATVGGHPDFTITVWNWKEEQPILRTKAFSQEVFKVTFNPENEEQLTTAGSGHIKFWLMALTFTGLKLQGYLGRFGKTAVTDIEGYIELPDGKVLTGSEWGNLLLWEGGLIKVELCRHARRTCHIGPINQIMLDEGEVITAGDDGCIRIWDFETIDTADAIDESEMIEMEPINEMQVGKNVKLYSMVKIFKPGNSIWYAQDANGAIWKLDLSFSNITQDPKCLYSFHTGPITAMVVSPFTYLMATTSHDCSVRIFDFAAKRYLTHMNFREGGTALIWAPRVVSYRGGLLIVGFEDGVIRLLELFDPRGLIIFAGRRKVKEAQLRLRQALKPHTAAVTTIAYEQNGEILATGSKDKTVFFFVVGKWYEPIGYINVPGPVAQLVWTPKSYEKSFLLIMCENGYVLEVPVPEIKETETLPTFEIKDLPMKCFHFRSIKSRILRDIEIERRRKRKEEKEKEKEERRKLRLQMLKAMEEAEGEEEEEEDLDEEEEEEEEEPLPEIFIPEKPCPILCGFYSSPNRFWISLGGYDSGFLYHCKFPTKPSKTMEEQQDEPFNFHPVENTDDNPIRVITFSLTKMMMFCGMQKGQVRVYILKDKSLYLTDMQNYWSYSIHDNDYGQIQALCPSYDDRFVVTCGADGNIFVFNVLSEEELEEDLKATVPPPRIDMEKEKRIEDIEDPNAFSIEGARQKREYDQIMKEVEEIKAQKREKLKHLRDEFEKLLVKNSELPGHMQLHRMEFDVDTRVREETERKTVKKIKQVEKELAWEKEKHRIALSKLQQRFRDSLEFDTVIVHAIQTEHKISTYRLLKLSGKYNKARRLSQTERRASKFDWKEKEVVLIKRESQKDTVPVTGGVEEIFVEKEKEKEKKGRPRTLSEFIVENQVGKMKKIMVKAEKAQNKILQRRKEWEELYKSKPEDDYEDPKDVLAIKEAQNNMGDFNLKTAPDYKIPEQMRINAAKKEEEIGILEAMAHEKKFNMNKCIISLRDQKIAVIEEIQCLVQELKTIHAILPEAKHLPIPEVPQLQPEEVPEKKYQYDEEILLEFKLEQEKKTVEEQQKEPEEGFLGFGTGITKTSAKDGELLRQDSKVAKIPMVILPEVPKPVEFPKTEPTEVELEIMKKEEIRNVYMQQYVIDRIRELIITFDAEFRLLRHQKLKLDIQMKLADLHHVTLFQEMLLLKNFEKQENILQERVNSLDREQQDMKWRINENLAEMEERKNEISKLQEQEKAIYANFQASLGENNKFANFLLKVLKKNIKRVKKKEVEGEEEEDESSKEDSDDESSFESDEEESESEDETFDESLGLANCDPALYEMTLQLREKRLDIEETLSDEKKLLENLRKEYDAMGKKVKVVAANLQTAEEALEAYQREKQQRLNELLVVIPLKLHQIECVEFGEIPHDLSNALVFSNTSLQRLQERIIQLQEENAEQQELNKKSRERRKKLVFEKREMAKKIKTMKEMVTQLMIDKFGKEIDLEALQTLSINKKLEELRIKKIKKELSNAKEIRSWEEKISRLRWDLMMKTKERTKKLQQMNELCVEKQQLEGRLNTLQSQQGNAFQGPRKADVVAREKVTELIQIQAEKILALKEEIAILRRKGGLILPPINSAR